MDIPGYKLLRELGRGGMATVYLAEQEKFERQIALKIMSPALGADPSFKERFIREAKLVAKLSHPNIVAVYDVGDYGNQVYMAMEYHTGGDLKAKIIAGLTPLEAVRVTCEIARALEFAHSKGVIHRDIKPDNILFRNDGSAVLTDFGIAKQGDASTQFTQMGMVAGTPKYMSPEQARGMPLEAESDLYSLGIVFYEAITGDVPFRAEDSIALAIKHMKDPPPPLPPHLKKFQPFLDRILAKEPAKRFHRGGEVASALEQLVASGTLKNLKAAAPATNEATQIRTALSNAALRAVDDMAVPGRKTGLMVGAVALLVVGGAGGAWYFMAGTPEEPVVEVVADPLPPLPVAPPPPDPVPVEMVEEPEPEVVVEKAPEKKAPAFDVAGTLKRAAAALAAGRLDNAVSLYRQVLDEDRRNKAAQDGLRKVADRYIQMIDAALGKGAIAQARDHLKDGERAAPGYPPLADAATRIANRQQELAAAAAPAPVPKPVEPPPPVVATTTAVQPDGGGASAVRNRLRAGGLASKGSSLMKQGDYSGARAQFEQALALDPTNATAQAGMSQLKQLGM